MEEDVGDSPEFVLTDEEEEEDDMPYGNLMKCLPENFSEDYLLDVRRLPERTAVEVDTAAMDMAKSRKIKYRGRAVLQYRSASAHPASGLLKMLNRAITRPPGVNEIVRINPRYSIVLEQKPVDRSSQEENVEFENPPATQGNPNSHYVLEREHAAGVGGDLGRPAVPSRSRDPCNTNIYLTRFEALKETLIRNVEAKWPNDIAVPIGEAKKFACSFFDFSSWLEGEIETKNYVQDKDCRVIVLVGVILTLKPMDDKYVEAECKRHRILHLPTRPPTAEMFRTMYLVDCDGREAVRLFSQPSSGLNPDEIVSGIPCALKGFAVPGNSFVVSEVVWPTPSPCTWPSFDSGVRVDLVLISGLQFSSKTCTSVELDLLCDYLLGLTGSPDEQMFEMLPKSKIFFLGNSFEITCSGKSPDYAKEVLTVASKLDSFFNKLAETMEVFLIPGDSDPTEKLLPQKAFQPILFPLLSKRPWSHSYHNPCRLKLKLFSQNVDQSLDLVLSSGSNVEEVRKYLCSESALVIGESMLKWGHLNPASSDVYPTQMDSDSVDPMVIQDSLPNFYVIGNQDKFGIREFQGTQVISLPSFSQSHQIATIQISDGNFRALPMDFKVCI